MQTTVSNTNELPVIPNRYVKNYLSFMQSNGVQVFRLPMLKALLEDTIDHPDRYLSLIQMKNLLVCSQDILKSETSAFQYGQKLDLATHGTLAYTLTRQSNLYNVIESVLNFISIGIPLFSLKLIRQGQGAAIRIDTHLDLGMARETLLKIYLGSIYNITRQFCRNMVFRCDFTTQNPEQWQSLTPGSRWEFNSESAEVVLPVLYQKMITAKDKNGKNSDNLHAMMPFPFYNFDSTVVGDSNHSSDITKQVQDHILKDLKYANIEKSAELLHMSTRHLRKLLADQGSSFREISTDIRRSVADTYLKNTPLPILDIALKLGFSDQSSFTRAYQRWTGLTPGAVRRPEDSSGNKSTKPFERY